MLYSTLQKECQDAAARLIIVTKKQSIEAIRSYYDLGHRDFAENKVQDLLQKKEQLPADIKWHLIGHLQTNKVKQMAGFVHLIHTLDSIRLAKEINKHADLNDRVIPVLIQVKVAEEESKYGIGPSNLLPFIQELSMLNLAQINVAGLMAMATFTDDASQIAHEFRLAKELFDQIKSSACIDPTHFRELSMGMSSDYRIALQEGSTMVRVGSLLFT